MPVFIITLLLVPFTILFADAITNFDDRRDIKASLFNYENQIRTNKLQHWIHDGKVSASPISFEPPFLDFPETPIGQPKWDNVKIFNEDETTSIQLYSISSSTIDFHCSLFKEEILPGGGNSSFDIIFLSRQIGLVKNTLFVHTSHGTFNYKISGIGVTSPYRIKSFFKATIPLNSSFASPIYFYNPYIYPIQILEMYTSGGDAHLELPNQSKQSSSKLWIVPPYETRTIMKVKYLGRKIGNFTSYIRIRTNTTDNHLGFIIPLQIEISNMSHLYCIYDTLYFGILRSLDSPKSLKLTVVNSASYSIRIKSVIMKQANEAINIDFKQINVLPGIHRHTSIATITFSAFKAVLPEHSTGVIIVKTFENQTLSVPFIAEVVHGSLVYDANNTKFFTGSKISKSEIRNIAITNTFDFTVAIYSISLPTKANCCFKIANLTFPIYIKSKDTDSSMKVKFSNKNIDSVITQIAIFSNISLFVIPLFVYNGKLTVVPHRPEIYKGHLDFGTLGFKNEEHLYFTLKNENPAEVIIFSMTTNWFLASVLLIGTEKGNNTILQKNATQKPTINFLPLVLKPYHFSVFKLTIMTPDTKGIFASDISVVTQYEKLSIPYYLRTTDGVISTIGSLTIKNCFPYKMCKIHMILNSTFSSYVEFTSIKFIPNDTRFYLDTHTSRNLPILLKPLESTNVGYIKFSFDGNCLDPLSDEFVEIEKPIFDDRTASDSNVVQFKIFSEKNGKVPCYTGFSTCTKLGYQWLLTADMNSKTYEIDKFIYKRIHQQWEVIQANDNYNFNITLQMDTSSIKGFLSSIQVQLIWPSILTTSKIVKFPLTQTGNFSFKDIYLENPSDYPVLLQLILISHYSDPYSLIELLGISDKDVDISNDNIFSLYPKNLSDDKLTYAETTKENMKIKSLFSIYSHNESIVTLLLPKTKRKFRVYFNPSHKIVGKKYSTVLILRNNLTSIETVWLEGQSTHGELLFQSGHLQEETSILHFELTEKHLKSCDSQTKGFIPSFTVRRPFVIKNSGKIPVYIIGFQFGPLLNSNMNENQGTSDFQGNDSNAGAFPTILENVKSDVENKGESLWCAGYGFEILECYGYRLEVNESLKLEIVFTPDFSLHKIIQQLQVYTSLSEWPFNITVQASLPAHMLHRCSQALARPDSEVLIWYMAIVILSVVTMAAILMSYYEADRIFTSNVIYRHLSSVAIGGYPHSSADRICDFRAFSKSSPFVSASNQLQVSSRSSVQDYLSIYNRNDCESSVNKRMNICKKHDEKMSIGLGEKMLSQSFCGKNIPEVMNVNDNNCNPLLANSVHHKKKKKRGLSFGFTQWIVRTFTQIINQNTALKPKLEDNFNYKTDVPSYIKGSMFSATKNDEIKSDHSNKSINYNKNKSLYTSNDVASFTNISQNTITNNNNNQPSHTKKNKSRFNCTNYNNQSKVNIIKQQEAPIATLNFAPIEIPVLDSHKCKKTLTNNKKTKKNNTVISEDLKGKTLRMDDNLSVSTDSSTEDKIKEIEMVKNPKLSNYKIFKSKQGNICFGDCKNNNKHVPCIEYDEDDSTKVNYNGFEPTKNNDVMIIKSATDNYFNPNIGYLARNCTEPNDYVKFAHGNFERKEKLDSKLQICYESHSTNVGFSLNDKGVINRECPRFNENKSDFLTTENKSDIVADELIQWENESVTNAIPEDFSLLSARTESFSRFIGSVKNNEDLTDEVSNSNVENWLCKANCSSFNNMDSNEYMNAENKIVQYNYHNFTDDCSYKPNKGYQIHETNLNQFGHKSTDVIRNYYKPNMTSIDSELYAPKIFGNSLHIKEKFNQNDMFNNDNDPLHNSTNYFSLELPGIAHGRKQSLLEYERRTQKDKDPLDNEWLSKFSNMARNRDKDVQISNSMDQFWDGNSVCEPIINEDIWKMNSEISKIQNNALENPLWILEKSWNQIEPGSQHDQMARTLLPVGLLSNETSTGIFSTSHDNLWKFRPEEKSATLPNKRELHTVEN